MRLYLTLLDFLIVAYAIQVPAIFINVRYGQEVMLNCQQQQLCQCPLYPN